MAPGLEARTSVERRILSKEFRDGSMPVRDRVDAGVVG
jgi:hypothetical protein